MTLRLISSSVTRVLSGIQPSGDLHIGNYLGAIRTWVQDQYLYDSLYTLVDLHALTIDHSPVDLTRDTLSLAMTLIASGLDPDVCTIFVQSHVSAHTELSWLLECTATFGEMSRMTQFKDKGRNDESVRAALFTYPALMAADILVYQAERVPVGEDQRQHLELTRDIAIRFNRKYGNTFKIPQAMIPSVGARVMDLAEPTRKMSKSSKSQAGVIYVLDTKDVIAKKISKAVTDTESSVRHDPDSKPGVSNLIELLCAATGDNRNEIEGRFSSYGALKGAVTEAITEILEPLQRRYEELKTDPSEVARILRHGASKASELAAPTLINAKKNIGLLSP